MLGWALFFSLLCFLAGLAGFSSPVRSSARLNKLVFGAYVGLFGIALLLGLLSTAG